MSPLVLLAVLPTMAAQSHRNLIVNADFSQGNTGFTTGYNYNQDLQPTGAYFIGTNPHDYHGGAASFGPRLGNQGKMMIINGDTHGETSIWEQTVKVLPNHKYFFGVWAASWGQGQEGQKDPSPARLILYVNDKAITVPLTITAKDGEWGKYYGYWKSGPAQSAALRIVDENQDWFGNDFAIADLVFHD